jgi:hypothetical protein
MHISDTIYSQRAASMIFCVLKKILPKYQNAPIACCVLLLKVIKNAISMDINPSKLPLYKNIGISIEITRILDN